MCIAQCDNKIAPHPQWHPSSLFSRGLHYGTPSLERGGKNLKIWYHYFGCALVHPGAMSKDLFELCLYRDFLCQISSGRFGFCTFLHKEGCGTLSLGMHFLHLGTICISGPYPYISLCLIWQNRDSLCHAYLGGG